MPHKSFAQTGNDSEFRPSIPVFYRKSNPNRSKRANDPRIHRGTFGGSFTDGLDKARWDNGETRFGKKHDITVKERERHLCNDGRDRPLASSADDADERSKTPVDRNPWPIEGGRIPGTESHRQRIPSASAQVTTCPPGRGQSVRDLAT
ncbi:hypothetical protein [Thioalkalivibrio sp. HK1]|uniref:hypothetical protein n=1 Tax=Thioalkalivibrio sp. HK1 TaxID=1469245 RepID=UPI00046EF508|nr:hypothetical protein [Thioalkalivibrio sp. HK1]